MTFGHGDYIFEESPKSIQVVIGVFCYLDQYCLNREKCESTDGYLTTPRSIHGGGTRGAWFFVHKVAFALQQHVKTTKANKTRFLFAKKDELVTRKTIVHYCSISINQIYKKRVVCGQQSTRDNYRCVLSNM